MTEQTLSDKIITFQNHTCCGIGDVKDAIKRLMEWINRNDLMEKNVIHKADLRYRLRKIFGKELTE